MHRAEWLPKAQALPIGRSKRVAHACGEGRAMMVEALPEGGWRAYCHRCHEHGYEPPPQESMAQRLARLGAQAAQDALCQRSVALPLPSVKNVSEWPPEAALWLYRAGLSRADIGKLGAYYHPPTGRVVLPVTQAGEVVFWQARALVKGVPKYLAPDMGRDGKGKVLPAFGHAESVTLTEDILSAYKVGTVAEGWAMMGTSCPDFVVSRLLSRDCQVNIWLDPDPPGRRAAAQVTKRLRSLGLRVNNIASECDPKLLPRARIKEILDDQKRDSLHS